MTGGNQRRSLIIVSRDYGELALAVSLLRGQQLARATALLLPERLFRENQAALPVPALPYATLDDLLSAVNAHQPELVFLFSGYRLALEQVLPEASLMNCCSSRHCSVKNFSSLPSMILSIT